MKLQGEPIVIEGYGMRIYTIFCAMCGNTLMDEDDALSKVQCQCGNDTLRLIRDVKMGQLLMSKEGSLQ